MEYQRHPTSLGCDNTSQLVWLMHGNLSSLTRYIYTGLVLLVVLCVAPSPGIALNHEGQVLLQFERNVRDPRHSLSNWDPSHPTPCQWTGILCSQQSQVSAINLSGKQLHGNITLDVRGLKWLQALNLSSNYFEGEIPAAMIGNSTSLRIVNLHANNLSGAISAELGFLVGLTYLDLSNNRLSGEIPSSLDRLTKLSFLNLSSNNLKGSVPQGRVLTSFTGASFQDNSELCGYPTPKKCDSTVRTRNPVSTNLSTADAPPPVGFPLLKGRTAAKRASISLGAILTICICAFLASKFVLGLLCYWRWSKLHSTCDIKLSDGKMVMFRLSGKPNPSPKIMLRRIRKLSHKDIIGTGGFGTVYKLVLDDKSAFAVKKLLRGVQESDRGFERELETLADIKHRNLVTLRGYYSAPQVNILVYDLMENGNLDTMLHADRIGERETLDWPVRVNIALASARGLAYLHHDCIPHIIHRDIKSSNILLDEGLEAHVSDFGLAKLISPQATHVTTIIAGTLGYLPPEYIQTGQVTEKGDVYSYGVVLLELLTGKRPTEEGFKDSGINMVQWAKNLQDGNQPEEIFDLDILGTCPDEELLKALDIAFQCLNSDPMFRPSMLQVVKMLETVHCTGRVSESGSRNSLSSTQSTFSGASSLQLW